MLVAGLLFGGAGTALAQAAGVGLAYSCQFPSGTQPVGVRVRASLPAQGTVGRAVSPGRPTVTVAVPRAALGDLTKLGAATVGATAKLTVNVAQSGTSVATAWQNLGAAQTALPPDGDLVLNASGVAQAVRPAAPGKVVFAAGPLSVDLAPRKADGTATSPSVISLSCAPAGGSDTTTIAAVAISDDTANPPGTGLPGATQPGAVQPSAIEDFCPPTPTPVLNHRNDFFSDENPPPLPPELQDVTDIPPGDRGLGPGCGFLEGLSNVKKLNGATSFGRLESFASAVLAQTDARDGVNFARVFAVGVSHFEPRRATLLSFGFVPVSAKLEITQVGNTNVIFTHPLSALKLPQFPNSTIAQGVFQLRLTDARVNGVPLNVGSHCRSAQSLVLTLNGSSLFDPPYLLNLGGNLTGEITIPPWSGCGVGEDLDPLLTASVSGPGNFVSVIQGPLCVEHNTSGGPCPPVSFGYTVQPGGRWTATSGPFNTQTFLLSPQQGKTGIPNFSCGSATMKGSLQGGIATNPATIGEVTDFSTSCEGTGVLAGQHFTVTSVAPWKLHVDEYNPGTDAHPQSVTVGHFEGVKLHFASSDCSFDTSDISSVEGGNMTFWYDNSTHTFSLAHNVTTQAPAQVFVPDTAGCSNFIRRNPAAPATLGPPAIRFPLLQMLFDPAQTIIQPRPRCTNDVDCPAAPPVVLGPPR